MPFALLIIGIFLLTAAIRGTQDDLFKLVKNDFTGKNNFIWWVLAILVVGSIGYIDKLRPLSITFLSLLIVVVLVAKHGIGTTIFQQFNTQLASTTTPAATTKTATTGSSLPTFQDLSSFISGSVN